MEELLNNPAYHALKTGDAHRAFGTEEVKFFSEDVSPFAAFDEKNDEGFHELYGLLPDGRKILYATPGIIKEPEGWQLLVEVQGLQFVFTGHSILTDDSFQPVPLTNKHVDEMIELTALTKPGPFGKRTIEFGHYFGIFDRNKLVAMIGQRLHVSNYTEISAVCTHPVFLGRGFAASLLQHQVNLILQNGQIPFLHVRADNQRAIALYERLGFTVRTPMNFYFLKKQSP